MDSANSYNFPLIVEIRDEMEIDRKVVFPRWIVAKVVVGACLEKVY